MDIKGWKYYNHAVYPSTWPHEDANLTSIKDKSIWKMGGGTALLARWTSDWDCSEQTEFYWCIKDDKFDISSLKAKRRYEINKGIKNFDVRIVDPKEYVDDIFEVYIDSLKGYSSGACSVSKESIRNTAYNGWSQKECRFLRLLIKKLEKCVVIQMYMSVVVFCLSAQCIAR